MKNEDSNSVNANGELNELMDKLSNYPDLAKRLLDDYTEYGENLQHIVDSGYTTKKSTSSSKSYTSKSSSKKSGSKKSYDPYDVHKYKSAQDFADNKYKEFYEYEDDYEDEDEAYDAAEDYWRDHH